MANIFRIDRAANTIQLGTTGTITDIGFKHTAGSQASPIDVTNTRQHGLEFHYSGNDYSVTGIRSRAQLVTTDTSAMAQGALLQAANNDGINAGVLNGALIEAIGKSTTTAATITMMRGALVGAEWSAKDTVANLRTLHVRTHTRDAATEGYISGTGYGIYIENEAVGGNGQVLTAGIYFKGTSLSAGNKAFTHGIDFSGATYGTADIKLSDNSVINDFNNRWGIGIASPSRKFVVIENDNDAIYIRDNNGTDASTLGLGINTTTGYAFIQSRENAAGTVQPLTFWVGSTEKVRIATDGVVTILGIGGSGLTGYDLKIGDTSTPDYGLLLAGDSVFGRVPYNAMNMDLDGSVIIRNLTAPATSKIEFAFLESGGTSVRFALATSAVGNATYSARSMLIAGPSVWNDEIVTVGYWQTNNSIFDNLACDTAGSGADLGVQNDLEVEGDIFTDSLKESTSGANITLSNSTALANAAFHIIDKASGNGIKVDTTTPTFGFADLLGDQFSKNTGGTKPTLVTYNGAVDAWQFSDGDEAFLTYHIPHDYVPGTDIHLHIHWSQNNTGATGGTIDFKYFAIYAKGHNQASGSTFTSTPITATFSSIDINDGGAGLTQYQQHLTEVTISAASATAALFDRDDFEPDGVIELTLEMDANNLTGTPSDPFIHYADIHYQTTSIIGTKSRTPDFYA